MENQQATLFRLTDIIGQKEVTLEQAALNREARRAAIAAGKKPGSKPVRPRPAKPAIIPVSATSWWAGIKVGIYPRPVSSLGPRTTAWAASSVLALVTDARA
jgi:prophage regulatory protein